MMTNLRDIDSVQAKIGVPLLRVRGPMNKPACLHTHTRNTKTNTTPASMHTSSCQSCGTLVLTTGHGSSSDGGDLVASRVG